MTRVEGPACSGLPADEALWRLWRRKGGEDGLPAFKATHWLGPGTDQMAATLAGQGVQARPARVQEGDLRYLELPTLAQLQDGSWVLLEAFRRGRIRVEAAAGSFWLDAGALAGLLSGTVLDLSPALPSTGTLWARLKPLFLRHRRCLLQILAAALMLQVMALATPAVTAVVLDRALPDGARSTLLLVLAGMLLATCHQLWLGWIEGRLVLFLTTRVDVSAVRGFLEHTLRCPFPFLQARTLGELMQAFDGFAAARDLLPAKTVGAFLNGAVGLLYLGVMVAMLPRLALLVAAATVLLALMTVLVGRAEARLQALQVEAQIKEQGLLVELVAGIATLKAAGAEGKVLARWRTRCRKVLALEWTRGRLNLGSELTMGLVGQALAVALFTQGGLGLLNDRLEVGRLFAFLQLSTGFTASLMSVVHTSLALMLLRPQLQKAQEILSQEVEPAPRRVAAAATALPVVLEDVWFRYAPGSPWVLQDYNLTLAPGGKRRLEGPSGFGKSTVLRLLAGLHRPERGKVLVGGMEPGTLRGQITFVPQFVRIFGGSVLDNLRLFSNGAERERILAMAGRTGLQAWVETLPMGYRTLLPPGGRNLSGGQRQLIAITGALASGRPLLLLDEALSNLDAGHAAPFQELLAEGPWTVVAASHTPVRTFGR